MEDLPGLRGRGKRVPCVQPSAARTSRGSHKAAPRRAALLTCAADRRVQRGAHPARRLAWARAVAGGRGPVGEG